MSGQEQQTETQCVQPGPGSRRTLIFHIGDHKTGTTSIQTALATGRVFVNGRKPFYSADMAHNYVVKHFKTLSKNPAGGGVARKNVEALANAVADATENVCVISAEAFEDIDPLVFRSIAHAHFGRSFDDVRVVGYVRPHAQRIVSSFAEQTKIGVFLEDLTSFSEKVSRKKRFDYYPRLAAWRDALGDTFVIRPFVRNALHQGSVVHDLMHSALGDVDIAVEEGDKQNESASLEDLLRIKYIHQEMGEIGKSPQKFRHSFGWLISHLLDDLPRSATRTKIGLHRDLAERTRARYLKDARRVDQEFFGGTPHLEEGLDKALEEAIDAPQPSDPRAFFSGSELRSLDLTVSLARIMLQNGKEPWPSFLRQVRVRARHAGENEKTVGKQKRRMSGPKSKR